ncbi:MAG: B12-binding domain-containing radical SAM protein [Elusimicrobia bacterium]|nr:B12-binding domain-containing radical SAM protein [Elusimicrobiota bacterium]
MNKILMLQPLYIYKRWPVPHDFMAMITHTPTLAFAQLRSILKSYQVDYIDGTVEKMSLKELTKRVMAADIIFINTHSSIGAFNAEANLRHILDVCPDKPIIMGGHHATAYDFQWLGRGAHFVVRNEGEETIVELIKAIENNGPYDKIKGISWRDSEHQFHRNDSRPLISNLDDLPLPDWSIFNRELYDVPLAAPGYSTVVETSRGCPHRCKFCAAAEMWSHTQRFKSAERILEELRVLSSMGVGNLFFADDNFGAEPARYEKVYKGILKEGMEFNFGAFMRADVIAKSPETVRLARKAGLRLVSLGIESSIPRILEDCNKALDFEQSKKAVEILRSEGIFIAGFFMIGYMGQTQEETDITFKIAREMSDYPIISIFEPRCGTEDFSRATKSGDLPSGDMFYHNTINFINSQAHIRAQNNAFHRRYLFHMEQFRKLLFGTPTQKKWFRTVYWNLTKSVLSGRLQDLYHPWEMVRNLYK